MLQMCRALRKCVLRLREALLITIHHAKEVPYRLRMLNKYAKYTTKVQMPTFFEKEVKIQWAHTLSMATRWRGIKRAQNYSSERRREGGQKAQKMMSYLMYGSFDGIFCVIYRLCYSYHNVYRMKYKDNQIIPVYIIKFQSRNLFLQRYF